MYEQKNSVLNKVAEVFQFDERVDVLADKDNAAFLITLKDLEEAGGGVGALAGRVGLKRRSLYKILSNEGNPTLDTLQEILKPLGLRVSVALNKAA